MPKVKSLSLSMIDNITSEMWHNGHFNNTTLNDVDVSYFLSCKTQKTYSLNDRTLFEKF